MQARQPDVDLAVRNVTYGVRSRGQDDTEDHRLGTALFDSGTGGDIIGAFLLAATEGPAIEETKTSPRKRDVPAWAHAVSASTEEILVRGAPTTERMRTVERSEISDRVRGAVAVRPHLKGDEPDNRFAPMASAAGDIGLPRRYPGVLVAGTHEGEQHLIFVPAGGRLVCVSGDGGPAGVSTPVFDVDTDEEMGASARLHQALRVVGPVSGHLTHPSEAGSMLCQQYGPSPDGGHGFGAVYGEVGGQSAPSRSYGGATGGDPTSQPTSHASPAAGGPLLNQAGPGPGLFEGAIGSVTWAPGFGPGGAGGSNNGSSTGGGGYSGGASGGGASGSGGSSSSSGSRQQSGTGIFGIGSEMNLQTPGMGIFGIGSEASLNIPSSASGIFGIQQAGTGAALGGGQGGRGFLFQ